MLGPGAFVITLLAPVAAQLIQRKLVHPQVLVALSLTITAAAMWYYGTFNLATDYDHLRPGAAFQGFGYGFFFVPLSIIAYSQLRPDQNNRASSLTNFFRNWGGSFGIALITTVAQRRQQFHQSVLAMQTATPQFGERAGAVSNYLVQQGFSGADATVAAKGYIYQQFLHQISFLAFMDCFRVIAWVTLAAVPLLFAVKHFRPGGKAPAAH